MNIKEVLVLIDGSGPDEIHVNTDLPSPFPESVSTSPLSLKSSVMAGGGLKYAKENFPGIRLETISMKAGKRTLIHE